MPSAYDMSSSLLGQAGDAYGNLTGFTDQGTGQALGDQMAGMVPDSITQNGTQVGAYGPTDLSADLFSNMNDYLNPYYNQVLDSALGKMSDVKDQSLNSVGAQASASGAFGGSRHGLVESQVISDYNRDAGTLASQMKSDAFNSALGQAQQTQANELNRGQFMSGTQAQMDYGTNAANAQLQAQLAASKLGAFGSGYGMGSQQDLSYAGLNQQGTLAGAQGMQGLGSSYFDIGNSITNSQGIQGSQQQQLLQSILSGGAGQFQELMQDPYKAMDLMKSIFSTDPRNQNQTTTSSGSSNTSNTPGLFDYLSLFGQTAGAIL